MLLVPERALKFSLGFFGVGSMKYEPDIVKELREAERLGFFKSKNRSISDDSIVLQNKSMEQYEVLPKDSIKKNEEDALFSESFINKHGGDEDKIEDDVFIDKNMTELDELLFQNTNDIMIFVDKTGNIIKVNQAGLYFSGFTCEELIGKKFWKLLGVVSKKNLKSYLTVFKNTSRGKVTKDFVNEVFDKKGKKHIINFSSYPIGEEGKVSSVLIIVSKDITEWKKNEEALRESEEKYRSLFENMPNGFAFHEIVTDEKGKPVDYVFLDVNSSFEEMTGLKKKEIIGKKVTEVLKGIEHDTVDWIGRYGDVALNDKRIDFKNYAKPLDKWYHVFAYSPSPGFFATIFKDITELELNENKLKDREEKKKLSEESYRTIFNSSTNSIFIHDLKTGKILDVNKTTLEKFEYTKQEIMKLNIGDLSVNKPPYTQKEALEWIRKATEEGPQEFVWFSKKKNDELFWHKVNLKKVNISGEERILVIGRDITEKKQITEKLEEERKRIEYILNVTKTNIIIIDAECNLQYVDAGWQKIYGDPSGRKCYEYLMGLSEPCQDCSLARLLETKEAVVTDKKLPRENNRIIEVHSIPFRDLKGRWLVANFTVDITERKKAEEVLQESEHRFRSITENIPGAIYRYRFDSEWTMIFLSNTMLCVIIFKNDVVNCIHEVMGCKRLVKKRYNGGGIKKLVFHGQNMIPIDSMNANMF